jgi:FKBP-type peptidyl-prolyl cis-trans isomerase
MARLSEKLAVCVAGLSLLAGEATSAEEPTKSDPLHPRVKMVTTLGDIVLELDAEKAPVTVLNFIDYAKDKYYDGIIFHRVIDGFMIQGGGFTMEGQKTEGLRSGIKNEWKNGLKNVRGSIAMARLGGRPDSATAQFFINTVDNSGLDQPRDGAAYAVFGKVVEGMDTVNKIRAVSVGRHASIPGGKVPTEPIVIKSVTLVTEFDRAKAEASVKAAEGTATLAKRQAEDDREKQMKDFIKKTEDETGKKAVTTDSGLAYIDLTEGDGPTPNKTDKVEVHYTGWLTDGSKFDSSVDRGTPFPFSLTGGVIKGWLEGVATMKVGGKRKLIIPPELGYGKRGSGAKIPPDSILVFDVELLRIVSGQ